MELLERSSFLQALAEYGDEAVLGNGRLVLLSGESGIGKTVLLEEFQERAKGARWLRGACDGLLTPRPLGPVFDIAAQLGGEFAELCRRAPRDRLFTAFLAELDSPGSLTIAVIEDVHWADEATIDLLSFLGRRLDGLRALLVATYRDDELAADHPLRVTLGNLATQRACRRIRLPPLTQDAVRALAGPRDMDAAELYRVTGGNPFYVSEILEAGWPSVPPTVSDAVGARLARAGAATRKMVEAAAVIGTRVDPSLLTLLAGDAADDCLETGILVADGISLRFRHELVRIAVQTGIAPQRKLELHKQLLAVLEERGDADSAVLAHHAEGAGDATAVLRHAPEAGRICAELGAHREAAAQFERALRHAGASDAAALAPLHESLADEYALLDRLPEAEAELRIALARRRELGDDLSVGKDLCALSMLLWQQARSEESWRTCAEAVQILQTQPPGRELAWAQAKLAWAQANVGAHFGGPGHLDGAIAIGEQARDLATALGEPEILSHVLNTLGCVMRNAGKSGFSLIEQALQVALAADVQEAAGRAYCNLQALASEVNLFAAAERYYAEGMAYCESRELSVFSTCLKGDRAARLLLLGRWDEAAESCVHMLAIEGSSPVNRLRLLIVLGLIRGRRGDVGAWELLDEAVAWTEGTPEPQLILPVRVARAELSWLSGEPSRAAAEARAGLAIAAGFEEPWAQGSAAIWLSRLRQPDSLPAWLPEPYARELAGDWAGASAAWDRLGRPYDAALAWLGSEDEAGLRQALNILDGLGARAAAAVARRRMRELGITAIPRGPRPATKAGPAGLTAREQEVLALLAEGLADLEISRRLYISERTVHRHVSAVLSKLGVSSRTAAARQAARLGIETISKSGPGSG